MPSWLYLHMLWYEENNMVEISVVNQLILRMVTSSGVYNTLRFVVKRQPHYSMQIRVLRVLINKTISRDFAFHYFLLWLVCH